MNKKANNRTSANTKANILRGNTTHASTSPDFTDMDCISCKHKDSCQFLTSDSGDLRFLLNDRCEYYMLNAT